MPSFRVASRVAWQDGQAVSAFSARQPHRWPQIKPDYGVIYSRQSGYHAPAQKIVSLSRNRHEFVLVLHLLIFMVRRRRILSAFDYDDTGKIVLDDIYNQTTPIQYYTELSRLGYCIPERAQPLFEQVIAARRTENGDDELKIVDVGCSYGVNAALIKHDQSIGGLASHYREAREQGLKRDDLIANDRELYAEQDDQTVIVGVDASRNAIDYAVEAGIIDDGIAADFERSAPNARQLKLLDGTDLIISTGCYGYISERTLDHLLDAANGSKPWMAHFVLRMFDYDAAAESLAERGYVTRQIGLPVRQRRFADDAERAHVLDNLAERGIDPEGREADGWYYAQLHLSCPEQSAGQLFERWDSIATAV